MPNWCNNYAVLSHTDSAQIDRVEAAATAGQLMNEFFPCPEVLLKSPPPSADMVPAWKEWRMNQWGVSWDIAREDITICRESPSTIALDFVSAWAAPLAFYAALETLGFEVVAYYFEPNMAFCGRFEQSQNTRFDIKEDPEWLQANIPSDILDEMNILGHY